MADQAEKLRQMIENAKKRRAPKDGKLDAPALSKGDAEIIAISSGKGGVGKTNVSLNLAIALAKFDRKVVIIDADLGLANIDVLLGIAPKFNLFHVIEGTRTIDDVLVEAPGGIHIISGGSGIRELANLNEEKMHKLIENLAILNARYDYIIIDTGAGISESVLSFIRSARRLFVVLTPDPASITDAYAILKNIKAEQTNVSCIINRVESKTEAVEVFEKLKSACMRFLGFEIRFIGHVLEDQNVIRAVRAQKAFLLQYPSSAASKCINLLANVLEGDESGPLEDGFGSFIRKLLGKR